MYSSITSPLVVVFSTQFCVQAYVIHVFTGFNTNNQAYRVTISETRDPGSCFLTVTTANDADGVCYFQLFIYGAIFVPLARSQWRLSQCGLSV